MSGIAGVISFDGEVLEPGLIEAMAGSMAHRGPDGIRTWSRGSVALGHCMLHTTPESLEETQPLANEDESVVLVVDGRVDNYDELRAELKALGAPLRSRADAELILRSYETWGRDCLHHIDGDFALAIWDARRHEAFCARDRLGAKPFYYHWDGRRLSFASELHAVLSLPWVAEELNEGMVAEFVAWEAYSRDETLWKDIYRLVAAHELVANERGIRLSEYWIPDCTREIRYKRLEEYVEHYGEILVDSVRRQSRSHRPLACEVSGGIDSSSVFALVEQLRREGQLPAPGATGYALHFDDGSRADEIAYARAVGAHLEREIHEIPPALPPLDWYRDWALRFRDFPHYPNTVVSLGIRQAARDSGSRVLLTGWGGDEWLTGSRLYYAGFIEDLDAVGFFRAVTQDVRALGLRRTVRMVSRFGILPFLSSETKSYLKKLLRQNKSTRPKSDPLLLNSKKSILGAREKEHLYLSKSINRKDHAYSVELLYSAYRVFFRESQNIFSSSFGLEIRDPLTSRNMVDFHFQTPEFIRQSGSHFRICHRRFMKGALPEQVRNRLDKAEFSGTTRHYLDRLGDGECFSTEEFAASWLKQGEWHRLRQDAKTSAGKVIWVIWGIFGCALVASSINTQPSVAPSEDLLTSHRQQ